MLTLEHALDIARHKEGYERCERLDHGFGEYITIAGVTAPCKFMICPVIQFYPLPSFQYHSEEDFIKSSEAEYRRRGWL